MLRDNAAYYRSELVVPGLSVLEGVAINDVGQ
jgi:hypothetical protein